MVRRMLGTTVAFAALAIAQPALAAETYVFDKAHTNIQFSWDHFGFSTTSAEFEEFSGELQFDPEDHANSSVEVTIDLDSVDSGFDTFNGHLTEKPEWFNTDEYPEATFTSTGIEPVGDNRLHVTGDLTLKGVTKEVTLDTTINKIGQHPVTNAKTIGFDATTTVSRSAFNMGKYAPSVSDEVTISISSEMQRESDL
ncbi:YceI family protein [Halofilum ochraceum]|uniref:YceI family protein n=1 Tax=Halofilum ochraceum TaxID=1611323 RepID=UPI00082BA973|nr:YceI family protein [Halofilum ochraceum]